MITFVLAYRESAGSDAAYQLLLVKSMNNTIDTIDIIICIMLIVVIIITIIIIVVFMCWAPARQSRDL